MHRLQMSHCLEVPDEAKLITFKQFAFEMLLKQAFKKDLERFGNKHPL